MIPFLKEEQHQRKLEFSTSLYTQESVVALQKALEQSLNMIVAEQKIVIDVSTLSDRDCLEILNFCLYHTKKQ